MSLLFRIISVFILIPITIFGQKVIVDKKTGESIPFVHIISSDGKLLGTTDLNGHIGCISVEKSRSGSIVSIHHISYENKDINLEDFLLTDSIKLHSKSIDLPEVVVKARLHEKVYLVLSGYFRSYQIENGVPKFYTDGQVEYYIPQFNSNKIVNRVIQCRVFKNPILEQAEKHRVNTISLIAAGVPYIDNESFIGSKNFSFESENGEKDFGIFKNGKKVGAIVVNIKESLYQINIDMVAPKGELEKSFLGYTSRIKAIDVTENYSVAQISELEKSKLVSRKEYRKIFFKHKNDKDFAENDVIHEFYAQKVSFVLKSQLESVKTSSFFGLPKESNYYQDYWQNHNSTMPSNIEKNLGTSLILIK